VSAFQVKSGHAFKQRVSNSQGYSGTFSTGTADFATAKRVGAMVKRLKHLRKWNVLNAIVAKHVKLKDVFDAYELDQLDAFMARAMEADLDLLLTEWKESGANERYVTQCRRMIPEGHRFPASRFTRATISAHLAKLTDARAKNRRSATGSTKNRHRAAISQFSKWLVEREVIAANPVRDVQGKRENPARMIWYEWPQAKAIVDQLSGESRALEALMAGSGIEWQAALRLKRGDIDFDARKVHAKGSKNRFRNRVIKVTESWAWEIFSSYAKQKMAGVPLFTLKPDFAITTHRKALAALEYPDSTLHDWRHTYAVNWIRSGKPIAPLKRQLGHAPNSTEVERVYGVWIVDDSDYSDTRNATTSATTAEKLPEVRHG
jgi:integrase